MTETQKEIINHLKSYFKKYPSNRFCQGLYNLDIWGEYIVCTNDDYIYKSIKSKSDDNVLNRILKSDARMLFVGYESKKCELPTHTNEIIELVTNVLTNINVSFVEALYILGLFTDMDDETRDKHTKTDVVLMYDSYNIEDSEIINGTKHN